MGDKYPKINTLWKRDERNKNRIIEGDFSAVEFANIATWLFTEKIDGTNIRVSFNWGGVKYDGRTDDAQIPPSLMDALQKTFPYDAFVSVFPPDPDKEAPSKVILYGEGYGAKIQRGGGLYRDDVGFILFDVWIDGWWLRREAVEDIAFKFNIPVVPILGIGSYQQGVDLVKSSPQSRTSKHPKVIEGIVARSHPLVLFRSGEPLMWKLKVRDYTALDHTSTNPLPLAESPVLDRHDQCEEWRGT